MNCPPNDKIPAGSMPESTYDKNNHKINYPYCYSFSISS